MNDGVNPGADTPPEGFSTHWNNILSDVTATATEYDENGWESLALRPGHVTPLAGEPDGRWGFDVLLPDDEFTQLETMVEQIDISDYELYSREASGGAFLMVVMRAEPDRVALIYPLYYRLGDDSISALETHAKQAGVIKTHLRRLRNDRRITLQHDDPGLFFF